MRTILFFLILFFVSDLGAQTNLVPNPSFEINSGCPNGSSQLYLAIPWTNPNFFSPDYYDTCSTNYFSSVPDNWPGYKSAHSGGAYSGIGINWGSNEYIQVKLLDTLQSGKKYCVGFYVSLAGRSDYASNGPQLIFSDTSITSPSAYHFIYPPQISNSTIISDTVNWTFISGNFISNGGEQYIIIGDFHDTTNTPMDSVGNNNWGLAYYYIDDVSVIDCGWSGISSATNPSNINLFPNPSNGNFELKGNVPPNSQIHFYNLLGEEIISPMELPTGNQTIPIELNLAEGIYFYRIISGKEILQEEKLVIVK